MIKLLESNELLEIRGVLLTLCFQFEGTYSDCDTYFWNQLQKLSSH